MEPKPQEQFRFNITILNKKELDAVRAYEGNPNSIPTKFTGGEEQPHTDEFLSSRRDWWRIEVSQEHPVLEAHDWLIKEAGDAFPDGLRDVERDGRIFKVMFTKAVNSATGSRSIDFSAIPPLLTAYLKTKGVRNVSGLINNMGAAVKGITHPKKSTAKLFNQTKEEDHLPS